VSLVEHKDGGNWYWYAVVVYGSPNGTNYDAMYDIYKYNVNATCSLSFWDTCAYRRPIHKPSPQVGTATFDNVIHIDANRLGVFNIIWDNSTGIQAIAGNESNMCSGLCSTNSYQLVTNSGGAVYQYPDIAMWYDCSTNVSTAYYCYVDATSGTKLYVGYVDKLCNGVSANYPTYQYFPASTGYYQQDLGTPAHPRIACPDCNNTTCLNWTVVTENTDFTVYDIIGWTLSCGTLFTNNYTNGSMTNNPCSGVYVINGSTNENPAVSYQNANTPGMMIGWDCSYASYHSFYSTASIAIIADKYGQYSTICTPVNYLIVSGDNYSTYHGGRRLSISGRDYGYMYYTFCDNYTTDYVEYKDVAFGSCSLRVEGSYNKYADVVSLSPNPFTSEVTLKFPDGYAQLKVFDMTGNLLLTAEGNEDKLNRCLNELAINLPEAVYILRLETGDRGDIINKKLIKM
jgi:hypothetical protein